MRGRRRLELYEILNREQGVQCSVLLAEQACRRW